MGDISYCYCSPDVKKKFDTEGENALIDKEVVSFRYKDVRSSSDNDFRRNVVLMSKYSKREEMEIMDQNLRAKDLINLVNSGSEYNTTDKISSKNDAALKLFSIFSPHAFDPKSSYESEQPPQFIKGIAVFITRTEWKNLKTNGKIPTLNKLT